MKEITGDLWKEYASGSVVAITTNGMVTKSGKSVMPRGCARQAAERYPELPKIMGSLVINHGNHVFDLGRRLVSFPVEEDPYRNPEMNLIDQSCRELVELTDYKAWQRVVVPRPGCGGGGLSWDEVRPVLEKYFDDRFYIISLE